MLFRDILVRMISTFFFSFVTTFHTLKGNALHTFYSTLSYQQNKTKTDLPTVQSLTTHIDFSSASSAIEMSMGFTVHK